MSNLVFVSGDFCSGSTLVHTLFRKSGQYYCLYEPLHQRLPEFLILRPDPGSEDHHFFAEDNYAEMAGFDRLAELHSPQWATHNLYLATDTAADDLYRYMTYLIGTSFGRFPRVMFKENRIAFRLAWIRTRFPAAKIVHIWRDKEGQWKSIVRRGQEFLGKEEIGQNEPSFNGFSVADFCEDLKGTFPQLDARNFRTGYDRFCALWELSYEHNRRSADISVNYRDLTDNFVDTWQRVWSCIGAPPLDSETLKEYVVPPEKQKELTPEQSVLRRHARSLLGRWGFKYAQARVRAQAWLRGH